MSSPIVLILGAGSNIGQATAKAFASQGYKVALASRSMKDAESTSDELHIPTDLSNSNAVIDAFAKVKSVYGPPSVIVYNGKCQVTLNCAAH
jgi:NAD(P)-dependent dehydrogenase (short-subunit alcohol dehydrogenase family)